MPHKINNKTETNKNQNLFRTDADKFIHEFI